MLTCYSNFLRRLHGRRCPKCPSDEKKTLQFCIDNSQCPPERRVTGPSYFGDQEDIFPDMMLAEKRKMKQNTGSTRSCGCGDGAMVWIVERLNYCVLTRSRRLHWPGCADAAPQLATVENMALLSRSLLCSGVGDIGGVIGVFGMGNILMLSSASAPSRVPQVV